MARSRSSPPVSTVPSDPLVGLARFTLRRRRLGSWERYDVCEAGGGALLLTATRYGRFWWNLLAGFAGVASGVAFAGFFLLRALAAERDSVQVALGLVALLGGVVTVFLVDILLSPSRDIRAHVPGGDRRSLFRLLEARKINLHAASFTLIGPARERRALVRKDYLGDALRKRWTCTAPDGSGICEVVEDSTLRSLLHRALGGAFGLFATDYLFLRGGREVGRLNRRGPWRKRFLLTLDPPPAEGGLDPSLAVALAVLADSIEWR